jgi:hypothetical protein
MDALEQVDKWNRIKDEGIFIEEQDIALVKKRIPHECPFCRNIDNVSTEDFKVLVAYPFTSTDGAWRRNAHEPEVTVFCERCEEEIRPEDITAGVENEQ